MATTRNASWQFKHLDAFGRCNPISDGTPLPTLLQLVSKWIVEEGAKKFTSTALALEERSLSHNSDREIAAFETRGVYSFFPPPSFVQSCLVEEPFQRKPGILHNFWFLASL